MYPDTLYTIVITICRFLQIDHSLLDYVEGNALKRLLGDLVNRLISQITELRLQVENHNNRVQALEQMREREIAGLQERIDRTDQQYKELSEKHQRIGEFFVKGTIFLPAIMSEEAFSEFLACGAQSKKIKAVLVIRKETGFGLEVCKDIVDKLFP
ncbi:MAG TPA: hypothetical protein PKD55_01330 [Bellilinea sp.]|nr:hypothetical protein [Bellilinea sp.]